MMPRSLTAQKLSDSVLEGFKRLETFRRARAYAVREYMGTYMAEQHGMTGERPINLVFLTIRALIPNIIQQAGATKVLTDLLEQREYAEKLGLGLSKLHKKLKLHRTLRSGLVDTALSGLSIYKTSLAQSGQKVTVDADVSVDPMQIYTKQISLDDLSIDPMCRRFQEGKFIGHRVRIERSKLLSLDGWDHDLIKRLPRAGMKNQHDTERSEVITQEDTSSLIFNAWQDYVNVVEVWVPEAEAICYIPDPAESSPKDFLKVEEYYGPESGLYTFGSITQPVPDNPFPVAPVGVWRDLADMTNRLFKKAMSQADRQKNLGFYAPANFDAAEAAHDAIDGEWLATEDPGSINIQSFEGADPGTVQMTQNLYGWFNLVAGNPDMMSGSAINSNKATGQQILQQNASVSINDMRDMTYETTADIAAIQAWFMHNDDLLFVPDQPGIPLIKRLPTGEEQQLFLTPADKTGSFGTLGFEIVQRSMTIIDPAVREKALTYFVSQVIPQAFTALQLATQAGQPFNISTYLMNVAEDLGIASVVDGIWEDPAFRARMQWHADTVGSPKKSAPGMQTDGGSPVGGSPMGTPTQDFNQNAQRTAAVGQADRMRGM
ncbi:MAG: hypothetical protein GY832_31625 [Chloroflexi bacterium]|nr:hypothetical protein [Chloroflexota bacterium]